MSVASLFERILSRRRSTADGREGYVYVAHSDEGPMRSAAADAIIHVEGRGPPWIVVDDHPATAIVARWPGRLWRVHIIEAATPHEQREVGGPPLDYARYTRAISVKVIAEESTTRLFGPQGSEVIPILDRAMALTKEQVDLLVLDRHPGAPAAYDRTLRRWAQYNNIDIKGHDNLDGALMLGIQAPASPVNGGLSILHSLIFGRAEDTYGEAAFEIDDDNDAKVLKGTWSMVDRVMRDAALALGAPDFVSDEDRVILLRGWQQTLNSSSPQR